MAKLRLDQEPVQHRAVVAVVVEPIDQGVVEPRLLGLTAPDDALVEVGDPQGVVLGVELEEQGVLRLGHVVDRAGIGRIENFLLHLAFGRVELDLQIALRDRHPGGAVAIDSHGAQVDDVDVEPALDHRGQGVVGGVDVVGDGVALVLRRLHRIGRGALFGEVNEGAGPPFAKQGGEARVVLAHRQFVKGDVPSGGGLPGGDARLD